MNESTEKLKIINEYPFFLWLTMGYALFYVICLYQNRSGITFPLFTLGTLLYFILCMKKMDMRIKPYSFIYMISIELFGLSTCLTDSGVIIFLNKLSIFFLLIIFLLHNFFEDRKWNFIDHLRECFSAIYISFAFIHKPFVNLDLYKKRKCDKKENKGVNKNVSYIFLGAVISVPIVAVVLVLLITSDEVFKSLFLNIFDELNVFSIIVDGFFSFILFVMVFFFTYMLLSYLCEHKVSEERKETTVGEPLIAITVCSILSFIYIIFCTIQFVYLFLGSSGFLKLPKNMTYAEYARQGFFQLLFVCIINLIVVLVGIYFFKESKILKGLLCTITLCTFVMIASSTLRMLLYIQYKYLTFLRVFVLWSLLIIALIMIGVMISIFYKEFNFFKYSVIVVTSLYMIFSFIRVDYFIAKVNIDNMDEETQYAFFEETAPYDDYDYLIYNLSYDAAPVILSHEEETNNENAWNYNTRKKIYIDNIENDTKKISIRNFNLSRFIAKQSIE